MGTKLWNSIEDDLKSIKKITLLSYKILNSLFFPNIETDVYDFTLSQFDKSTDYYQYLLIQISPILFFALCLVFVPRAFVRVYDLYLSTKILNRLPH